VKRDYPTYRSSSLRFRRCRILLIPALRLFFQVYSLPAQAGSEKTPQIQVYLQQGQAALRANETEAAAAAFQKVLTLDPKNVEANMNLGTMDFLSGQCAKAELELRSALAGDPALTKARAFLAICEKRRGQLTGQGELERAFSSLKDTKVRIIVGVELADFYYQRGDLDRTVSVLQTLTRLAPDNIDILYFAQLVYSEMADNTLNKLALLAPDSARMQQVIAEKLVNAGNLKDAILHYRKALALDPYLPGTHYELAEALLEATPNDAQTQAEAIEQLQLANKVDGISAKTEDELARVALLQYDSKTAYEDYARALALNPNEEDAQLGLARLLMQSGKPEEAAKYLRLAVDADPLNAEAHYKLAMACRALHLDSEEQQQIHLFQEINESKDKVKQLYREMNRPLRADAQISDSP
jgi:tetratricopeptide (TPR) repeat protein